jgi:hypothetical protein
MGRNEKTGWSDRRKVRMKRKTNFDHYLEGHLMDPAFAERFRKAGQAWDAVIKESDRAKETNDRVPSIDSTAE